MLACRESASSWVACCHRQITRESGGDTMHPRPQMFAQEGIQFPWFPLVLELNISDGEPGGRGEPVNSSQGWGSPRRSTSSRSPGISSTSPRARRFLFCLFFSSPGKEVQSLTCRLVFGVQSFERMPWLKEPPPSTSLHRSLP